MKPEILYHYCSQDAFLSILRTRTFWCSALSLSNDTMEGKWIHKIFSEICDEDNMEEKDKNYLIELLTKVNHLYEGLGFCLSKHSDSLSQWRGYAQNAEGFCIGFSKKDLNDLVKETHDNEDNELSFNLIKVKYNVDKQQEELKPTYEEIKKHIDKKGKNKEGVDYQQANKEIIQQIAGTHTKFFKLKNPAFQEEEEWRVVSGFHKDPDYRDSELPSIKFRSIGNCIVPYRPFRFDRKIINEVVLGPKNQTPIDIIKITLEKFGYFRLDSNDKKVPLVRVEKSKASYR